MIKHDKVTNRYSKCNKSLLYRASAGFFVTALTLLLFCQGYILYLNKTNKDIILSNHWLPNTIPGHPNWKIDSDPLRLNLKGQVRTNNISFTSTDGYSIKINKAYAEFDLFQLLKGASGLKKLELRDLHLNNQENDTIVDLKSLCLSLNARSIHIEEAYGEIANTICTIGFEKDLYVNFERFLSIRNWRSEQQEEKRKTSLKSIIKTVEEYAYLSKDNFIESAVFDAFLIKGKENLKLKAQAIVQAQQDSNLYNFHIPKFTSRITANISPLLNKSNAHIRVDIPHIKHPNHSYNQIKISSHCREQEIGKIRSYLSGKLYSSQTNTIFFNVENDAKINPEIRKSSLFGKIQLFASKEQNIKSQYQYNFQTNRLNTHGSIHTDNQWIQPIWKYISFKSQKHPILTLNDNLKLNWKGYCDFSKSLLPDFEVNAKVSCKDLIPYGVPMKNIKASIYANPSEIKIYNITSKDKITNVKGLFYQNFDTLDYRILVKGYTFPHLINPWLDTLDFWVPLWEDIQFPNQVPYADFDISGQWRNMLERDIFGQIQSHEISYKGIDASKGRAILRTIPRYLEIYDIEAYQEEGTISGDMNWVFYPHKRGALTSSSYNFASTLQFSELLKFMPEDLKNTLSHFQFNSNPYVSFKSKLYKPIADNLKGLNTQTIVNFEGNSSLPLQYYDYPLDNLNLTGNWKPGLLTLNGLKFGIAEGEVDAVANIEFHEDKPDILQFSGVLNNADGNKLKRILTKAPEPKKTETPFNISLKASGKTDPEHVVSKLVCDGEFTMTGPKLQEFHLLGPLSKVLSKTPIAFSSIKFLKANGNYTLKNRIIDFSLFRMEGNAHRLDASGKYFLNNDQIDFRAKLFLLGGLKIPVVQQILNAVNPIAHVLEFTIAGTLNNPNWRFLIDPRNIFSSPKEASSTESTVDNPESDSN